MNNIQRGHNLVLDASRLAGLVRSDFPQSKDLADKFRRIAMKSGDVHNCILAFVQSKGELTPSERRGLQILLTHEEYTRITSSN